MITISVDRPMRLDLDGGNVRIRSSSQPEMKLPMADVEFSLEVPVPVARVAARPVSTGNSCFACGGMTVRTGSCETCTTCGTTGGCG